MEIFGNSGSGGRSQALMLGVPAVLVSVIGVVLLCVAEFGVAKNLEQRYRLEAEKSSDEKKRLIVDLKRDMRIQRVAKSSVVEPGTELIPPDDPRRIGLESNRDKEAIYLEKLISLNTEEPEYKYKLAMVCLEKDETRGRGLAILRTISPADEPGHVAGHLYLANHNLRSPTTDKVQALRNVNLALAHTDLCLKRDKTNSVAVEMKAKILYLLRKYPEAYEEFLKLFRTNPSYFRTLVDINGKVERPDRNVEVLRKAIEEFDGKLEEDLSDGDRIRVFQDLTQCYLIKKDFKTIQDRLLKEIEIQSADPKNSGKRVWAEHLLSNVYRNWLQLFPSTNPQNMGNRLTLLKKAHFYHAQNEMVLRELTRLGGHENEQVAAAARSIYNASEIKDAPAVVMNELGVQALSRKEHDKALRYFELARKKTPRAPEILNNLSYTYLIGETPNPKRALKLVDEALKILPNTPANQGYRTHFHDTRGNALMMMGKVSEAVAEFEFALIARPNSVEILESLIKCYKANDMDAGPYERHLIQVNKINNEQGGVEGEQGGGESEQGGGEGGEAAEVEGE